jgi:predicted ATPase
LTIEGFKSIRELKDFPLRALNVLIGANGAGKSNFVGFFRLLGALVEQRLQLAVQTQEGGADACLYMGPKVTKRFVAKLSFGPFAYEFALAPTVDNRFVFDEESAYFGASPDFLGSGHDESHYTEISSWGVYHFHDTSLLAGVRRQRPINDNEALRPDAENLASFLYRIRETHPDSYNQIRGMVQLAAPFFDDFNLRPVPTHPAR